MIQKITGWKRYVVLAAALAWSPSAALAVCGDGTVEPGESCDDGNQITEPCPYGAESCTVCAADCTEQPGVTSYCGDTAVDGLNGESCDDGNRITEVCA